MGGGGLCLGIAKVLIKFREGEVATFYEEMRSMHVNVWDGYSTALCGLLSLCSGVSLGPEAPIGALGGATGSLIASLADFSHESSQILVLCGICAGSKKIVFIVFQCSGCLVFFASTATYNDF